MKEKTNAMRKLDSLKIPYREHDYTASGAVSGQEVAAALGQDPARLFKTLVTTGKTGAHYVFMIPVAAELDLKKAAACVGEKSVEMLRSKDLLPLTGYIHGGCSPIGMKKQFQTVLHHTVGQFDAILCSGGKIGLQIEISPADLARVIPYQTGDIVKE